MNIQKVLHEEMKYLCNHEFENNTQELQKLYDLSFQIIPRNELLKSKFTRKQISMHQN